MKDTDLMPFGIYKGKAMANVPASYLMWVEDNVKPNAMTNRVLVYIKDNRDAILLELKNQGQE